MFVGLDLGGVNSSACIRDLAGVETLHGSAYPERPTCVLLPLIRREKVLAGDAALRNDRGLGHPWPPLAMAPVSGWNRADPPMPGGRLLLGTVWQSLIARDHWQEPKWEPQDGLPVLNKPAPSDCLAEEASTILKQLHVDPSATHVVLSIPNELPEESQESLLSRLPTGARLVWRSIAAAMSWAEANANDLRASNTLVVLDAGLHGVEISVFEFRQQTKAGKSFYVPVRRLSRLLSVKTDTLIADFEAPFHGVHPDLTPLETHLGAISNAIGKPVNFLICGPLAAATIEFLQRRLPGIDWPKPDLSAIARGSCLFAWRLAQDWPTYLDVLSSLELFTLTEQLEPKWLSLIPTDCEVEGGRDFHQLIPKRIFIEKGTSCLASWLQRSGDSDFRKLSTDLPARAEHNAWVDLNISSRSAGGFARVRIEPSAGQFEVFGSGQHLMLNWHSMERISRKPTEQWPPKMVKFGWPRCGILYAHRPLLDDFLNACDQFLEYALDHRNPEQRMANLAELKARVARSILPHQAGLIKTGIVEAGGDTAPVNLLLCFSTKAPCEFMEATYLGQPQILNPSTSKESQIRKTAKLLWSRLKFLQQDRNAILQEKNTIIYILGRMAGYAPDGFQSFLANEMHPVSNANYLFAAGRVLNSSAHGRRIFQAIQEKSEYWQSLNNNWLRMLVYVLYQRPEILKDVPREHIVSTSKLCVDVFDQQVRRQNVRVIFMNSLRALALLLRARRHVQARELLVVDKNSPEENLLASKIRDALQTANGLSLRSEARTLVGLVGDWLESSASTDVMPPIAPPDEESEDE